MSTAFHVIIAAMGLGRVALGLAPFVAAGPSARLLGFPAAHDTATARLMGRFFGVRDVGLGVLVFYALAHPEVAPFIFLFNAAMDGGDLVAISIPLVKRQGIDRAAAASASFALIGGLGWLIVWLLAR
ncbi:MAG: hypothetical protein IPL61_23955 [Myxococcales bacterium]|nr:hypothetical protein [Myxococcales bacterium]